MMILIVLIIIDYFIKEYNLKHLNHNNHLYYLIKNNKYKDIDKKK
jgi:hypothetical protein